ncbi:DUF1287 domain-containing protein [Aestuariivirga sp.]|uniref:DUF1287 domain-containing protein n=1 Tax=Aestuariivirga sp. TaxID=2650926 RepID=UPI0039E44E29
MIAGGLSLGAAGVALAAAPASWRHIGLSYLTDPVPRPPAAEARPFAVAEPWAMTLIRAAERQIGETLFYDPRYQRIAYPGGDVPRISGVCTDVVIRAYRDGFGADLQRLVHDDMAANFTAYPKLWGLSRPDSNIDHRRVPNLKVFFARHGRVLEVSADPAAYRPGDIITMKMPGGQPHIAIVTHRPSGDRLRPEIVHNYGAGTRLEDALFAYVIDGHFRFDPRAATSRI